MPSQQFLSQFFVKIGGSDVSPEFMDDVIEIVVDSSLYLPGMFTIMIRDADFKWANDPLLDLGKAVEIQAQAGEDIGGEQGLLMKGEITALEPNFSAQGKTTLLVRGYNKSHRLHRGKQTRTFLIQSDSDIVKKIAGEVGLSPQVDTTSIRYDYVLQNNQTNMEFLQARAERLGFKVFAAEDKLYFKKAETSFGSGPELALGDILREFRPVLAATHQPDKITLFGWDHKQKKQIKGQASPNSALNQGGIGKTGGAAASVFGAAEAVITDRPVFTPDEATALAKGLANDFSSEFIQAEGVCYGHPKVKAGYTITIANVGKRFSGKYFVTAATHTVNEKGYNTYFSISGRQPNTISHLVESSNGHGAGRGLIQGVGVGLVTNLNDPDDLGRVKVKYPWLGDDVESDWIRIAAPGAGADNRGFYYLPEVNDEMLLAFEHGDVHHPFVIGGLWNNKDKPPKPNSGVVGSGRVNERIIQSRSGHVIILDDTNGSEKIIVEDKTGNNRVEIDSAANTITIEAAQDIILKAGGKIDLDATGDVTIKGMNVNVQGQTKSEIKATQVAINGSTTVDVKGGMVNLN